MSTTATVRRTDAEITAAVQAFVNALEGDPNKPVLWRKRRERKCLPALP